MAALFAAITTNAKTLVVYYSFTNNVHTIVSDLSTQIDADVIRIEPAEKGIDYAANNYAEGSALISAIRNNPDDAASYPAIDPVEVTRYIDCLERTLYNGVISGMSVDGGKFFYPNPLSADGKYKFNADNTNTRQPWFGCACCPSNLCRFIPSVPGYVYGVRDNSLYVNLFLGNTATINIAGKNVVLQQTTEYPWDGDIAIKIIASKAKDFDMKIRIPGWVRGEVVPSDLYKYSDEKQLGYSISVNGEKMESEIEKGYFSIKRKWKKGDVVRIHFDMQPRTVIANANVKDDNGRVAFERGPLVYCAEGIDNPDANVHNIFIGETPKISVADHTIQNTESDNRPFTVKSLVVDNVQVMTTSDSGRLSVRDTSLRLIPYYSWNHRGAGLMDVWFASSLEAFIMLSTVRAGCNIHGHRCTPHWCKWGNGRFP